MHFGNRIFFLLKIKNYGTYLFNKSAVHLELFYKSLCPYRFSAFTWYVSHRFWRHSYTLLEVIFLKANSVALPLLQIFIVLYFSFFFLSITRSLCHFLPIYLNGVDHKHYKHPYGHLSVSWFKNSLKWRVANKSEVKWKTKGKSIRVV